MSPRALSFAALATCAALVGCNPQGGTNDLGDDPVRINRLPTGSIQTPSVCERAAVDQRVTFTGADSFAFLWTGDHYQVAFADTVEKDIFVVPVSATGLMLDAPIRVEQTPGDSHLPSIVQTHDGFIVAWQELADRGTTRVHALDRSGRPIGDGKELAAARSWQMRPVLSHSPYGVAVSWMDQSVSASESLTELGDSSAYIGLLDDQLGLRSDPPPQRIAPGAETGYPWVAGDDGRLAVLWSDDSNGQADTYFSPVASTLSMSNPINVRDVGAKRSALLGRLLLTDFGFLATWEDHRDEEEEIYMSLLDPAGNRYAGGLIEEPGTGSANWPHMAWTGSAAGIVYYQFRNGRPQVFMTLIDETGARIGGGADMQMSNTPSWARFPDVVWNGHDFAVMWIDSRDGNTELYFNRAICSRPAPI